MKISFKGTIRKGIICPLPSVAGCVAVGFSKFKPDEILDFTAERPAQKRTLKQNAFYWDVVVKAFEELGHERFSEWFEKSGQAPKDSAHAVIKAAFLDKIEYELQGGKILTIEPSTACLTTAQFSQMTERAEIYLNGLGIYLQAKQ